MSLISGLFTVPVGFAIQTYNQKSDLNKSLFNPKIVHDLHKMDLKNGNLIENLPFNDVTSAIKKFINKAQIRKPLEWICTETPHLGFCSALATTRFIRGNTPVIILAPGFYEADKDACNWVMNHDISYIKSDDAFKIQCIPYICQLSSSIFGMCFLSFLPALGLAFTVGMISKALFSQWQEAKTDDFAIENSSDEDLKGGRRFFMAMQEVNIEERKTFWQEVAISAHGDNRLNILHPSITSRIQKIERAMLNRKIETDIEAEKQKLEELKIYIREAKHKIKQALKREGGILSIMKQRFSL